MERLEVEVLYKMGPSVPDDLVKDGQRQNLTVIADASLESHKNCEMRVFPLRWSTHSYVTRG